VKLKYPTIEPWLDYKRKLIQTDYDDLNLVTGREGKGKSKWARKVAAALDKTFTLLGPRCVCKGVARLHFDWDCYQEQLGAMERGQCIILAEFRGHRRESMKGDRMSVLDEFKENRGLGIHHFVVFNRITKLDRDLINDRVSDWSYIRRRGRVEVRQPNTELVFDWKGEIHEPTTYPHVGSWRFTDWEPAGWKPAYAVMKDDRMRDRRSRQRGDDEPEAPVKSDRVPPAILDMVLGELKK
jgi:hypothetical protein